MKATQLPIIINNATAGHKLQGSGVDTLFVHNWSYVTNWPYIILSRVKTRSGLFCRKPLSNDLQQYTVPLSLTRMLQNFLTFSPSYWSEEEYDELFSDHACFPWPVHDNPLPTGRIIPPVGSYSANRPTWCLSWRHWQNPKNCPPSSPAATLHGIIISNFSINLHV